MMMTAEKEVEQHIVRLAQLARAVGHAPDPGDPEADGGRGHRPDQGQPAGADRVPGGQPERLAGRARRDGRRAAARQRRHALPDPGHVAHHPRPGDVCLGHRGQRGSASTSSVTRPSSAASCCSSRSAAVPAARTAVPRSRSATSCTSRPSRSSSARAAARARCSSERSGIGYGRAARLIDFMAEDGIVGEFKSGSAREVLYSLGGVGSPQERRDGQGRGGGVGDRPSSV